MSAALSEKAFTIRFRFHGDLSFFLPRENRGTAITKTLREKTSVKDAIESCGVPHPEVDLIRCDDVPVPFEHSLTKGALVDVYGLTDSPAKVVSKLPRCYCGATARIVHGLCVGCLLRDGLRSEPSPTESFEAVLAEIDVPDRDWQLGRYRILEEIGRGGMGVIYRARQQYSRRIVALKRVLSYHTDSRETLTRFRREAEAAASLDHPNILPIYEVGLDEEGLPFFSMKFAPRGSLLHNAAVFLGRPRQVVQLLAKVSRGIDYAHRHGILHRDLKPGNILLDGCGEAQISDFGLARWIDEASDQRTAVNWI